MEGINKIMSNVNVTFLVLLSSCVHVSPPTEQRVETDEDDKEGATGQDDALIKKGNDGNDNEDGKDETELETLAIPEDNELSCKDDDKLEQCNKEL